MTVGVRIGQGIDVHAFTADSRRPLMLAGIRIPGEPGLAGHSDADVVLHAVVDALLGSVAAGDIGDLVGVDRPETADASSADFVTAALHRVRGRGFRPGNVDVTVVAQRPRLAAHREPMRARLAALLGLVTDDVSLKATTTDRLGAVGRGEGICAIAVVTVVPAEGHPTAR